jgi:hypothetical protein
VALFAGAARESWRQLKHRGSPLSSLSQITSALLVVGIVNATNTGDINSDRSTWLFLSLVFVVHGLRSRSVHPASSLLESTMRLPHNCSEF